MATRIRLIIILLSFGLLALGSNASAFASSPLSIQINGSDIAVPPFTYAVGGQVMVPIRWIAEQLGATSV